MVEKILSCRKTLVVLGAEVTNVKAMPVAFCVKMISIRSLDDVLVTVAVSDLLGGVKQVVVEWLAASEVPIQPFKRLVILAAGLGQLSATRERNRRLRIGRVPLTSNIG